MSGWYLAQVLKQIQDKKKKQKKSNAAPTPIPDAQATSNPPNLEAAVDNETNYNPDPDPSSSESSSTTDSSNMTRSCQKKIKGKKKKTQGRNTTKTYNTTTAQDETTPPLILKTTLREFSKALDYRKYPRQDRSNEYQNEQKRKIDSWRKNMRTVIMNDEFSPSDPIQILDFLINFLTLVRIRKHKVRCKEIALRTFYERQSATGPTQGT